MRYLRGDIWPAWPNAENNIFKALFAYRNMLRAHRRAYTYMKFQKPNVMVGFVHGWVEFLSKGKNPTSKFLARSLHWFNNVLVHKPAKKYMDFIALHYYLATTVKVGFSKPSSWVSPYGQHKSLKTQKGWRVYPQGIYNAAVKLKEHNLPIIVTENGISDSSDTYRKNFIRQHLSFLHAAMEDGAEVLGYCYWSLLDNFEWSEGYWEKFGLLELNRRTKERKPRESARWYGEVAKNSILEISEK